jgi:hypothetical protein
VIYGIQSQLTGKEAVDDLNEGRSFYDVQETGVTIKLTRGAKLNENDLGFGTIRDNGGCRGREFTGEHGGGAR